MIGHEILDSRGNATVEVYEILENGVLRRASVRSGASTGIYEACELRDTDASRYWGKGVSRAVANVNREIAAALTGQNVLEQISIDCALIQLDATPNKSRLDANAILGVSLACAKAAANALGIGLCRYIDGASGNTLPLPMMNILNGGVHASNHVVIQKFMIMPVSAQALRRCAGIFHTLKIVMKEQGIPVTGVCNEGGYAPMLEKDEDALALIVAAIEKAGYTPGQDFMIAIDAASAEWFEKETDTYQLPKAGKVLSKTQMVKMWQRFTENYPIISLENGIGETG